MSAAPPWPRPPLPAFLHWSSSRINFNGIGNANPIIYGLANSIYSTTIFHDVASGNNSSPCEIGTPNCPNGGSIGYNAGPGYDLATGWGTIDAYNLATKWKLAAPNLDSGATHTISATSVSTTSSLCAVSGGTLALTATVINGTFDSNGNPKTGATPTGTVQFLVDNARGRYAGATGLTARRPIRSIPPRCSSGGHTVSAVYSGDTTYAGSRGTLLASDGSLSPIDVVSATSSDFSITPCAASTAVAAGGTAPAVVFTLTPFHGFTGNVTLSASVNRAVAASYAFSTGDTVAINSTAGVPVTLTLMAFQSSAKTSTGMLRLASSRPVQKMPWYVGGSGAALACVFLLVLPRRRRWGALLAVVLSVGAIGASGCGSSSSSINPGGGGGSTSNPITNAAAGTYNITITAVASTGSGNLVHSANVVFTVR